MSYYKIRPRSGTAAQWTAANPILAEREIGFEYPTGGLGTGRVKMKMGDGSTHWNDLPYATVSPIVENIESTSQENAPSSAYVKTKFDTIDSKLSSLFKVALFTATTSASGNVSYSFGKKVYVLAAWNTTSDNLVFPYPPGGGSGEDGSASWWFHVRFANSAHNVVANQSRTFRVLYIEAE